MTDHRTDLPKDKRNRRRGLLIALGLHTAVVAGFIYPFLISDAGAEPPYEVVVEMDFRDPPREFASRAASAKERVRNEVKQPVAEREAAPINPTPPALPTPPAPPILTVPTPVPPVVVPDLPPAPAPDPVPTPRPSDAPVVVDVPARVPGPAPSTRDGRGKAGGTGKTTGAPDTGNGTTVADAGHGSAETGEGLDGNGVLTREVVYRPGLKSVVRTNGRLAINVCVNRAGDVIASKFNEDLSTITDSAIIADALDKVARYRFKYDARAPRQECGVVTIIVKGLE